MSRSVQKAEQKQHDILNAAESLFLHQGYGNSSMDQVALNAEVTKQTVYRYFPSKQALFAAVIEKLRTVDTEPYRFTNQSIADELVSYANHLLSFHLKTRTLGLYRLMLTEGAQEQLLATFMGAGPKQVLKPLSQFLQHRCELDNPAFCAQMFATMILAPRNQILMSGKRMTKPKQKAHVLKVTALFLNMITVSSVTLTQDD